MRLFVLMVTLLLGPPALAMSVAFVNPGRSDEPYWLDVSRVMHDAAAELGIELDIRYAERNFLREVELVREIIEDPAGRRPDYLVLANEKRVLARQLELAEAAGIPSVVAFNAPHDKERQSLGLPREKFRHWLGVLTPRTESAGYLTGKALIEAGLRAGLQDADGRLYMLAFAGDRSSDASIRRLAGLHEALREHPEVVLAQVVHAEWRRDKAAMQATHLLRRYPLTSLVWTANDEMAFGAMTAAAAEGREPGRELLFSAVNTSSEALQALASQRLAALAGGHFMQGAWALVLLHDYHHGVDFAADEGLVMEREMFTLFDRQAALRLLAAPGARLAYEPYSKVLDPSLQRYDFHFDTVLERLR